jgi:hypothetical protein
VRRNTLAKAPAKIRVEEAVFEDELTSVLNPVESYSPTRRMEFTG